MELYRQQRDERMRHDLRCKVASFHLDYSFDKVVFLDIDGVLNDEGPRRDQEGIYVEDTALDALCRIVEETGAEIVLSSSWRSRWVTYEQNGFDDAPEPYRVLNEKLRERGLEIAGFTPVTDTGPDTRPLQIRSWLVDKAYVTSFVILDDDDFWNWGWMTPYWVKTRTYSGRTDQWGNEEYRRGLTEEHADAAIRILKSNDEISESITYRFAKSQD